MTALLKQPRSRHHRAGDRARHGHRVRARRPRHGAPLRQASSPTARAARSRRTPLVQEIYLGSRPDARGARHPHLLRRQPRAAGRLARREPRPGRGHPRPQRDGQDHADPLDHRLHAAPARPRPASRTGTSRAWPSNRTVEARHRPRAAGPARLPVAHGRGEPRGGRRGGDAAAGRSRASTSSSRACASAARNRAEQALGRRAADAGHRARAR